MEITQSPNLFGNRHDILIAIGQYQDKRIPPILCCENDVTLLSSMLAKIPYINNNPPKQTIISTREGVISCNKTNILKAIDEGIRNASADDMLFLAVSCHGSTYNEEAYILPSDAILGNVDSLISFSWIKEMLDECKTKFKIIIVDACHSGDDKITFKSGAMPLYFKETCRAVDQLLLESTGVSYATSCTHEQEALIEPGGKYSIWLHALSDAINSEEGDDNKIIRFESILSNAASATIKTASQAWSRIQTPFYVTKVAGVMPLGVTTSSFDQKRASRTSFSIAEATTIAFKEKFIDTYSRSMEVEFDEELEKLIQNHGVRYPRIVTIGPKGSRVRLGIVFDCVEKEPQLNYLFELQALSERFTLDRVILPSVATWEKASRNYANQLRKLHLLQLNHSSTNKNRMYRDFCQLADYDPNTSFLANEYSDIILRQMGKLFHIVLSDIAAPSYDQDYGKSSFGTSQAMHYEEQIIFSTIPKIDSKEMAVDLGCGTGRHAFLLSKYFQRVEGFDFSPGMIEEANRKKRTWVLNDKTYDNVYFHLRDVEEQPLDFGPNSIDMVVACFGMGSFVDDLVSFLMDIKYQLRPGGKVILSFYNRDALFYRVPPPWRDPSLSAVLNPDREELKVTLSNGDKFKIFCRAYRHSEINGQLSRLFDTVQITSSPAFASFLPSQLFLQGPKKAVARDIFASVDTELAKVIRLPIGAYFTAICGKNADTVIGNANGAPEKEVHRRGEKELIELLMSNKIEYIIIEHEKHEKVRNISDVERVLGINPLLMAKAILIINRPSDKQLSQVKYEVFVLQGAYKLDLEKVGKLLGKSKRQWRFATQKEVKELFGLEIGGVPPFGYSQDIQVYIDARLAQLESVICGIGNPTKSIKLKMKDLISIAKAEVCDIASVQEW